MRHPVSYQTISNGPKKEFLLHAVIEADRAETENARAFVEKTYGVTPETLIAKGLSLFPSVLHVSIQEDNHAALREEDFLLAWDNASQRKNIVALRPGNSMTRDDRIHIEIQSFWPMIAKDGLIGFDGTSRNVRLEVIFSDIDQIASLNLDLLQTSRRDESKRPIYTFDETCADRVSYGEGGYLAVQLIGESLFQDIRVSFSEAAMVAYDALSSESQYAAMSMAA